MTPKQEHALEYRTAPEQAEAYAGTAVFVCVTARANSASSFRATRVVSGTSDVTLIVAAVMVVTSVSTAENTDVESTDCTLLAVAVCVIVTILVLVASTGFATGEVTVTVLVEVLSKCQ